MRACSADPADFGCPSDGESQSASMRACSAYPSRRRGDLLARVSIRVHAGMFSLRRPDQHRLGLRCLNPRPCGHVQLTHVGTECFTQGSQSASMRACSAYEKFRAHVAQRESQSASMRACSAYSNIDFLMSMTSTESQSASMRACSAYHIPGLAARGCQVSIRVHAGMFSLLTLWKVLKEN